MEITKIKLKTMKLSQKIRIETTKDFNHKKTKVFINDEELTLINKLRIELDAHEQNTILGVDGFIRDTTKEGNCVKLGLDLMPHRYVYVFDNIDEIKIIE